MAEIEKDVEEEPNSCCASLFGFTKKTGDFPKRKDDKLVINITDKVQADSFKNNKNADAIIKPPLRKSEQVNTSASITEALTYDKKLTKYYKCIEAAEKAIANEEFAKAEHFITEAYLIDPNDSVRDYLKRIQDIIRASQPCSNVSNDLESISKSDSLVEAIETDEKYTELTELETRWREVTKKKIDGIKPVSKASDDYVILRIEEGSSRDEVKEAQNYNDVTVKTEINYNKHVTDHLSNENEYNKCIDVAEQAMIDEDLDKANRILLKASRMNPNAANEIRELLTSIQDMKRKSQLCSNEPNDLESISKFDTPVEPIETTEEYREVTKFERTYPTTRVKDQREQVEEKLFENREDSDEVVKDRDNITIKNADVPSSQPGRKEATSEQIYEVKRVLEASDDYGILRIEEGSSRDELKKALRTLKKKLHPDRNNAPGAAEAIQKATNAFERLESSLQT